MKVTANAQRAGAWWAVDGPEVPGVFTQVKRLEQIPEMVADAVATMLDLDPADVEVQIAPTLLFAGHIEVVWEAKEAASQAAAAQARASELMRTAARLLREEDELPVRDVAELLGVTHQRVSQLVQS